MRPPIPQHGSVELDWRDPGQIQGPRRLETALGGPGGRTAALFGPKGSLGLWSCLSYGTP